MPIKVRFDKNGFQSPVYGLLGRGKDEGRVYTLPDEFGLEETVKVPVMDRTSKPPKQVGEIEITRYKNIPSSAEIITDDYVSELKEELDTLGGEEAQEVEDELASIKNSARPKVATPEKLEALKGGKKPEPKTKRRSRKVAAGE